MCFNPLETLTNSSRSSKDATPLPHEGSPPAMTNDMPVAEVFHETSSGLKIVEVRGDGDLNKILIDTRTRHTFPMDEVQWRELEMYVVADLHLDLSCTGSGRTGPTAEEQR